MNQKLPTTPMARPTEVAEPSLGENNLMNKSTEIRKPIRVLLVDDSSLIHQGLKTFLSKNTSCNIRIVGVATTRAEAVAAIQASRPHVVMLEVLVGQASGIDLCKAIRESHPNIGVLFFSQYDNKDLLRAAILAGAQGYLLKTATAEAVAKSISIIAAGEAIMDQQLTEHVLTWVRDGSWPVQEKTENGCSDDDLRLLSFVASGKTNKEIAQELNVSPGTVTTRLVRIYKRLRISRRSEAARYFVEVEQAGFDKTNSSARGMSDH